MNDRLPLVSVVTPSYNKGSFIEQTILSIRNQTYPSIEHIVIDGGSTDETLDLLRKYEDRLVWISEPDKGQSDAINKGWRMAKGTILAYLNADDTYMPWAVETAVQALTGNPDVGMVYGDCNIVDERGTITGKFTPGSFDMSKLICGLSMIPQPSAFIRRSVFDDVGFLDIRLHMAMDVDLWLRIAPKYPIEYVPKTLANFRLCPGTKSFDHPDSWKYDALCIDDKLFRSPHSPPSIRALKRRCYASMHIKEGTIAYRQRRMRRRAAIHFLKAFWWNPRCFWGNPFLVALVGESFCGRVASRMLGAVRNRRDAER